MYIGSENGARPQIFLSMLHISKPINVKVKTLVRRRKLYFSRLLVPSRIVIWSSDWVLVCRSSSESIITRCRVAKAIYEVRATTVCGAGLAGVTSGGRTSTIFVADTLGGLRVCPVIRATVRRQDSIAGVAVFVATGSGVDGMSTGVDGLQFGAHAEEC